VNTAIKAFPPTLKKPAFVLTSVHSAPVALKTYFLMYVLTAVADSKTDPSDPQKAIGKMSDWNSSLPLGNGFVESTLQLI
jgi:hypothetical protein